MPEGKQVEFSGIVLSQLPTKCADNLRKDLPLVFSGLCPTAPSPARILVSRLFKGYTQNFDEQIILGLEVQYNDHRYETHIVKIGKRDKVKKDHDGWMSCTKDRQVASRIFAPVQLVEGLEGERVAVLYRDAYTLFGLDQDQSRPRTLERVTGWAVQDDRPEPLSVERSIAHIYTDLGRWFFPGATSDKEAAASFYRHRLRFEETTRSWVLQQWREEAARRNLRRDAVWLICGRDKPDADPISEPARYLDPVDFVDWTLDPNDQSRLPDTLVGRSHGDLHGRNILLGVRRGETEYPAVFDYEDMGDANVLVWDFAKLETELKIRLLPDLYDQDEPVRSELLKRSKLPAVQASANLPKCPSYSLERAHRIGAFLAFDELLHDRTRRIHSRVQAEQIQPPRAELQTGVKKLDRLLAILLRIRKEAALWLGYERRQRIHRWMDEYYFALSVYGLMNVRWDYEPLQTECALIAAGVAAARMPSTPKLLQDRIATCIDSVAEECKQKVSYASYRIPLAAAHNFWKRKNEGEGDRNDEYEKGRALLERVVQKKIVVQKETDLAPDSAGRREASDDKNRRLEIHPDYYHAVPLIAEYALLETECNNAALAEPLLESLRPQAVEFGDFETLGRIGRLFKDSGDRRWKDSRVRFKDLKGQPAWKMYENAMLVYKEAFLVTNDYYTGINAATLALLTGDIAKAEDYAAKVADICAKLTNVKREDRYWVFATEGEAAVIRGRWDDARRFYQSALAELTPGQGGMADSAYKQLRRLARVFEDDEDKMKPILDDFENSEFRRFLSLDMFPTSETTTEGDQKVEQP